MSLSNVCVGDEKSEAVSVWVVGAIRPKAGRVAAAIFKNFRLCIKLNKCIADILAMSNIIIKQYYCQKCGTRFPKEDSPRKDTIGYMSTRGDMRTL